MEDAFIHVPPASRPRPSLGREVVRLGVGVSIFRGGDDPVPNVAAIHFHSS